MLKNTHSSNHFMQMVVVAGLLGLKSTLPTSQYTCVAAVL